jgi:hypothetical protein
MAKGTLFIGFGMAYPGYQQKSLKLFATSVERWRDLEKQGVIDSFETVLLDYHAGDLAGFTLLHGDREKLNKLRMSPEFESAMQRAAVVLSHFGFVEAFSGEEVQRRLADYQKQAAEWG